MSVPSKVVLSPRSQRPPEMRLARRGDWISKCIELKLNGQLRPVGTTENSASPEDDAVTHVGVYFCPSGTHVQLAEAQRGRWVGTAHGSVPSGRHDRRGRKRTSEPAPLPHQGVYDVYVFTWYNTR